MIGQHLLHYQITARIGSGGMGEVYRAEDSKLEREVALKVLPEHMASDPERLARFRREAKTVAALNHPNIVTIFSVEETQGVHFLTMELVRGRSLDELLLAEGLPVDRIVAVALSIVDALHSAHEHGIVHRDLKPANVMVGDDGERALNGRVKVLDFGLAKLTPGGGAQSDSQAADLGEMATLTRTQEGMVVGTPHYMSPEQACGGDVDHRSDIFSFGVMLFEMATGRRPFEGSSPIELLSAVLKDPAPALGDLRPGLPRALGDITARCLEKAPENRHQTARELRDELRGVRDQVVHGRSRPKDAGEPAMLSAPVEAPYRSAFVGRDAERVRLDQMLEEAAAGRGGLVLLGGEPGVGKTRLGSEILNDGRRRGMLGLVGHAYDVETSPFIVATEILEGIVRWVGQNQLRQMLGDDAPALSRLLPELRQLYPDVPEPGEMPPELQQRHLFRSVLEFLTRASAVQPMVMLLDDLHWADESSLLLIEHIAPWLVEIPVLMIGTYRDVEADIGRPFARSIATLVRAAIGRAHARGALRRENGRRDARGVRRIGSSSRAGSSDPRSDRRQRLFHRGDLPPSLRRGATLR